MTMTLEPPTEAAYTPAEVWTVPGVTEASPPNFGFGSGDTGEAQLLADLDAAFTARRVADAKIVRLAVTAGQMMALLPAHHTNPADHTDATDRADVADHAGATNHADHPLHSHRNIAELLVDIGRIPLADAHRLHRVGLATEEHSTFLGEPLPATFALVRAALDTGTLPVESANHIIAALTQATPRAEASDLIAAEHALVAFAAECPADMVRSVASSWRDALDVDGIEPRENTLTTLTSLRRTIRPNGMKRYILDADPLSAAYLDAAIDVHVSANIRRPSFTGDPANRANGSPTDSAEADTEAHAEAEAQADAIAADDEALFARRSIAELSAEALINLARHGNACTNTEIPIRAATIVVRMTLESLISGLGEANIDGIEQPISARTARQMAADAGIIPLVLGADSQILDLGTSQRLFSTAQKIAMGEQFGGCAWRNCSRPPSHTEAHHIKWWSKSGPSDLSNGILLCTRHHHEVHRNNWMIEIRDGTPWFIPPSTIDPHRTPRRGGKPPAPTI